MKFIVAALAVLVASSALAADTTIDPKQFEPQSFGWHVARAIAPNKSEDSLISAHLLYGIFLGHLSAQAYDIARSRNDDAPFCYPSKHNATLVTTIAMFVMALDSDNSLAKAPVHAGVLWALIAVFPCNNQSGSTSGEIQAR